MFAKTTSRLEPKARHWIILAAALALALLSELSLRMIGFGQSATYVEDPDYEYIHAPNQDVRPFGNRVITNQLGMRSGPLMPLDDVYALVLGDSVINGGNQTDHEALATTILEKSAQMSIGPHARILNVSAGSWGPDNVAAFLQKHGTFNAKRFIAVFSSHDIGDIMTHEKVIGVHPLFENERPSSVLINVIKRYGIPRIQQVFRAPVANGFGIDKYTGQVNPGWLTLRNLASRLNIPLTVVLHKSRQEWREQRFNEQGSRLLEYLKDLGVSTVMESGFDESSYIDDIHLTAKGQKDLAATIRPLLGSFARDAASQSPALHRSRVATPDVDK